MEREAQTMSAQLMPHRGSVWLGAESTWHKQPRTGRSTISTPFSASVKLMLWEGIAAAERAKEILLPELHRWWGENKIFLGKAEKEFQKSARTRWPWSCLDWCSQCFHMVKGRRNEWTSPSPQKVYCIWSWVVLFGKIQVLWRNFIKAWCYLIRMEECYHNNLRLWDFKTQGKAIHSLLQNLLHGFVNLLSEWLLHIIVSQDIININTMFGSDLCCREGMVYRSVWN